MYSYLVTLKMRRRRSARRTLMPKLSPRESRWCCQTSSKILPKITWRQATYFVLIEGTNVRFNHINLPSSNFSTFECYEHENASPTSTIGLRTANRQTDSLCNQSRSSEDEVHVVAYDAVEAVEGGEEIGAEAHRVQLEEHLEHEQTQEDHLRVVYEQNQ